MKGLLLLPLLAWSASLGAGAGTAGPQELAPLVLESDEVDGVRWWTVQGKAIPLERLLVQLARKSGRRLEGLDAGGRAALVTLDLHRRPLEQVLEYALGSVGLGYELDPERLAVLPPPAEPSREDLLDAAAVAWIRATTRFPVHTQAPVARLAQGEIAELRGLPVAANEHYQILLETFPSSRAAGEGLLRSGRIYERLGAWSEASMQFRELANRAEHPELHAQARLALARCLVELGSPESARFLLDTLDAQHPTGDPLERTQRLVVRAQTLNALGRFLEALQLLDGSARELDALAAQDVLRVRARSLEGVGMPGEAGRAWLLVAAGTSGAERTAALEEAARLALADGDELGVLFLHREAAPEERTQALEESVREARVRLGLEERRAAAGSAAPELEQRVVAAEASLEAGELDRASRAFQGLFAQRRTFDEALAARVTVGWARCLAAQDGLAAAIELLGAERGGLAALEARRRLDLGAARLFEEHQRYDLAVEAYRGVYGDPAQPPQEDPR